MLFRSESTDNNSNTSLHLATHGHHIDVVRLLLSKSANVRARNKNNQTPYHIAQSVYDIAKLLRSYGGWY